MWLRRRLLRALAQPHAFAWFVGSLCFIVGCSGLQRQARESPEPVHTKPPDRAATEPKATAGDSALLLVSDPPKSSGSNQAATPEQNSTSGALPAPRRLELEDDAAEAATVFSLRQAIDFGLRNNPRLRAALAAIERAQGQEQTAFAPFLPQIDFLTHYGVTSRALGPASAGITGITLSDGMGMHTYAEAEVQLQWMLCDFGRTRGKFGQAVAREQIAGLQSQRAQETVAFDVAMAYLQALEAKASRIIQEESIRRAESTLKDVRSRRAAGVADKDDVLRGDVQLAEAQDGLDLAEEQELAGLARLNNAMGRNASLPLRLVQTDSSAPFRQSLVQSLEVAAGRRPEIGVARQVIAGAQSGRQSARAEFLPRVYALSSAGVIGGEHVLEGVQQGVGLHVDIPLYAGGRHQGDLRAADADIREAVANSQSILDAVSLEVTLAYRSVTTAQKRIEHLRPAIAEARENLRLVSNKYRNGTATPTDIVDAETSLTRAQQRLSSATSEYLAARARLDYAQGNAQGTWLDARDANRPEPLPPLPAVKQP